MTLRDKNEQEIYGNNLNFSKCYSGGSLTFID